MTRLLIAVLALVLLVVSSASAGAYFRGLQADRAMSTLQAAHSRALAAAHEDSKRREAAARAEERRITHRVMEAADAAHLEADAARRSATRTAGAARELRDAYLAVAAQLGTAAAPTAVAGGSAPASGPGLVLTGLLDRAEPYLRSCAAALDQSRIAGLACERAYDALTVTDR